MSPKALSVDHAKNRGCSAWVLRAFFGIFFVAGSAMLYFFAFRPLLNVYEARTWDSVPCVIVSSEVERHRGDESDTFSIEITYRYDYDGKPYSSDRYHFMDISTGNQAGKEKIVQAHPPGRRTTCYVNPADPADAVLERGLTADMWWGLFPIPFLFVGLGGLIFAPKLAGSQHQHAPDTSADDSEAITGPGSPNTSRSAAGPVVLEPEASPTWMFVGSICICLFWNGIVSVFLWQLAQSFREGDFDWFLMLFLTPFVLIGLGLMVLVLYTFLALFNPRPELRLSTAQLPLGGMGQLSWQFRGSVRSVRNFKLSLRGEEQATYRRGTDTHTDENLFFEHVFYEAQHPVHIAAGEAEFEVPVDSMHTFTAGNNEVVWSLHVGGEIRLRPDVDLTFPIQVTPHESTSH